MSGIWKAIRYSDFLNIIISFSENPLGKIYILIALIINVVVTL